MNRYYFACGACLALSLFVAAAVAGDIAPLRLGALASGALLALSAVMLALANRLDDRRLFTTPTPHRLRIYR